jgi:hypothetical protein
MSTPIQILRVVHTKDADGFAVPTDQPVKSVRAYFEQRHGNVKWANRAAFSEATALFRFRVIPGLAVEPLYILVCAVGCFEVLSVEVLHRQYVEILAREVEPLGTG